MDLSIIKKLYNERALTKAELKKREEIAQAIEKEHPDMDMSKKMAISTSKAKQSCTEDVVDEARVYVPLKGHAYHYKTDDELKYIQKDAHEAAEANKGMNTAAENKYRDQVNDASTILHYRKHGGKVFRKVNEESLDEVSNYDAVVTYYRDQLHLDPYKLRGVVGKQLRDKIKASPAFHAWMRINKYESVDIISTDDQLDETIGVGLNTKTMHKHLISLGWTPTGPSGSHNNYSHKNSTGIISVPRHAKDINRITAMKILKQSTNLNTKKVANEDVEISTLTSNILEKIKETKKKSNKPSEEITFFGTGQDKKNQKPVATVDYGTTQ